MNAIPWNILTVLVNVTKEDKMISNSKLYVLLKTIIAEVITHKNKIMSCKVMVQSHIVYKT